MQEFEKLIILDPSIAGLWDINIYLKNNFSILSKRSNLFCFYLLTNLCVIHQDIPVTQIESPILEMYFFL